MVIPPLLPHLFSDLAELLALLRRSLLPCFVIAVVTDAMRHSQIARLIVLGIMIKVMEVSHLWSITKILGARFSAEVTGPRPPPICLDEISLVNLHVIGSLRHLRAVLASCAVLLALVQDLLYVVRSEVRRRISGGMITAWAGRSPR